MKKFKDFLYDKNDILIAVLILVVAAAIIAWRMDVILQYPKQLIHNDSQIETPPVDPSKTDDTASGDQTDNQTGSGDSTDGTTGENTGEDDANSGSQVVETLWAAGTLTKDVEVDVTGNTATAAIQCLVDAGLFKTTQSTSRSAPSPDLTMKKSEAVLSPLRKAPPRQILLKK